MIVTQSAYKNKKGPAKAGPEKISFKEKLKPKD